MIRLFISILSLLAFQAAFAQKKGTIKVERVYTDSFPAWNLDSLAIEEENMGWLRRNFSHPVIGTSASGNLNDKRIINSANLRIGTYIYSRNLNHFPHFILLSTGLDVKYEFDYQYPEAILVGTFLKYNFQSDVYIGYMTIDLIIEANYHYRMYDLLILEPQQKENDHDLGIGAGIIWRWAERFGTELLAEYHLEWLNNHSWHSFVPTLRLNYYF
ncbi:MAG: hypothetical protein COA57_07555 [Flavobacteriales bacterium]|nr:MAG: hypothetical protein COA57_07555 [Flavobacteriales bacterium]